MYVYQMSLYCGVIEQGILLSNIIHLCCLSSFVDFIQSINNNDGATSCVGDPLRCACQFSNQIANTV